MTRTSFSKELCEVRAALVHKSVDEWCTLLRRYPLHDLHAQVSCLSYNESLPYPDLNMRPALLKVMAEKAANGEMVRSRAPRSVVTPSSEVDVTYERQKCGGKGQTILVPISST